MNNKAKLFLVLLLCLFGYSASQSDTNATLNTENSGETAENARTPQIPDDLVKAEISFKDTVISLRDTAVLYIDLSWSQIPHPILFQPVQEKSMKNLEFVSVKVNQKKEINESGYKNITRYTYRLWPSAPGTGEVEGFVYKYAILGQEKEVMTPAGTIKILPSSDKTVTILFSAIGILLLLVIVIVVIRMRKKKNISSTNDVDYRREVDTLKKRVKQTDSSVVLKQVHELSKRWLVEKTGKNANTPIDELFTHYKSVKDTVPEEWNRILEECTHVQFGGGKREEHHMRDTIKQLYKCFELNEEEE